MDLMRKLGLTGYHILQLGGYRPRSSDCSDSTREQQLGLPAADHEAPADVQLQRAAALQDLVSNCMLRQPAASKDC